MTTAQIREVLRSFGEREPDTEPRKPRRKWTRLTAEQRAEVIERYQAGEHTTDLAKSFDVAKSSILKVLRDNNVPMRHQSLTSEQVAEASQLYESGLSLSQTSKKLGIPQDTIRLALIKTGVQLRPPTGGR